MSTMKYDVRREEKQNKAIYQSIRHIHIPKSIHNLLQKSLTFLACLLARFHYANVKLTTGILPSS